MLGQVARGVVVDDVAERIPPPAGFLGRDALGVEHPHAILAVVAVLTQPAGGVEDVRSGTHRRSSSLSRELTVLLTGMNAKV
ncbi:hypothetical protein JOF29_006086 [Kribbella aluminosa]|uniref:Uncharacterized protein n=1 Tax=Kribbella aluminosa TaxID=416017 RepID=A0ABS4UTN2_9ACTN|nr:hypothetical protein [Kribbella aluminosa]